MHFLVQLYWGDNSSGANFYEREFGMTIEQALDAFAASNLAIQTGILSDDSCCSTFAWVDFESAMTRAQQNRISWLWSDWHNPFDPASYHITTNGRFGSWKSFPAHPYEPNPAFRWSEPPRERSQYVRENSVHAHAHLPIG